MRILRDLGLPKSFDEIYAYLEAHLEAHNRVQIVVGEFLDMNAGLESRTPSPTFRQEDLDEDHEPKVKGKGVGKNSKFRPIKASPEESVNTRKRSAAVKSESPITEDMLHGPFDFSQHRGGGSQAKVARGTQNLPNMNLVLTPPKFRPGDRSEAEPVLENKREEVIVDGARADEVVEIPDDPAVEAGEALADNLSAMFPHTAPAYIRLRCVDLVGRPAAIDRFTEELLTDPNPPENWEQIYKKPFIIIDDPVPPKAAPTVPDPGASSSAAPPAMLVNNASSSSGALDRVAAVTEDVQQVKSPYRESVKNMATSPDTVGDADTAGEPQPGPSSSGSAAPEAEVDPVLCWELERHGQLLSMFPDICPDYLMEAVKSAKPPSQEQEPVNINIASLDTVFATKVETLLAMRTEERRQLPTRVQWETKRKAKEELEKWSGNMSVNDMLLLYSDDPAGHFGSEERKPESELYKQHAIERLKHEFR